ncbi:hypothetical protein ACFVV6_25430 [Bacillus mycoides]|uniref:Uncharacterized protein n=1 Tax=Bacillus proteolyticus TaxID=2026192 RepID=A0ABV3IKH8_9BACI|nr:MULTISPECIES: hypothetical protein [Bacillus cereus group]PFJ70720.1 hypothetical protein COI95_29950 [Bacillus cereus]KIV73484.1 hypothetical protein SZ39_2009 [Bacillus mycoides]MBJ8107997.1 hypothetical protein [Bacillus cereus group sp. N8]OSX91534.1 hypothetical protein BTJ45_03218 [Bacillus mycoides]PFJ82541.1 hypothetical protein COI97_30955 [Bacillus cereus]
MQAPVKNPIRNVVDKIVKLGVMGMSKLVPLKFKGLDVRLPFTTLKFDYDAGESGKANNY